MSSPKKWIRPEVGGKSPVMALKSVVLPAPVGAEDRRLLARRDRERDVVDGAQRAERARHAGEHQRIARQQLRCRRMALGPRPASRSRGRAGEAT